MLPGRTTSALVAGIVEVDPSITDITPFIDVSNELVTELCAVTTGTPPVNIYGYSDYRLELIERWLAAHFYCIRDPRASQEQAGSVQETLQGKVDLGLKATLYGQEAMRLDTHGALAVMDNAADKYTKVPPAVLTGVQIGITHIGPPAGRHYPWWG